MLVRLRSPLGTIRIEVSPDDPLITLANKAAQSWPEVKTRQIQLKGTKEDVIHGIRAAQTFRDAEISNGDLFYVTFKSPAPASAISTQPSPVRKVYKETIEPERWSGDARCFNYMVFSFLRKHVKGFQPTPRGAGA